MSDNYDRIIRILKYIKNSYKENRYFSFADPEDSESLKGIVDANRLRSVPEPFREYKLWDDFYIHFNPLTKMVMFFAKNLNIHSNEEEEKFGFIEWAEIEGAIYLFLTDDMKNITTTKSTYTSMISEKDTEFPQNYGRGIHSDISHTPYVSEYTIREGIMSPIKDSMKEFKTVKSVIKIQNSMAKLVLESKFGMIDDILRYIDFEKLNIHTMLAFLNSTSSSEESLKERKNFVDKVKMYLGKIKSNDQILKNLVIS